MSSFKLPKSICSKIDARLRDFFWGFLDSGHHIYPKAWDSLCKPKSAGGLGFRLAHDINNAPISKLGWIIASSADKPWANLLQSKYLRGRSFLTSTLQQNSSYIRKGIHKSIPLIKKGYCYLIGSSSSVNIWHDPWIPSIPSFTPTPITLLPDQQLVSKLIFPETRQWNRALLHNLFDHDIASSIQQIYIPFTLATDSIIWAKSPNGKFSVKSAYLANQNAIHNFCLYPSVGLSFSLLAAITCDRIWWSRNKLIFEDLSNPPNRLAADINKFFNSHSEARLSISPTASQWCPPPTGWIKFNFDAAIRPNATFIYVVGSDPNGMIISVCIAKEPPQSPVWGEAKAALLAMSTAVNLGYKFVIFEGNAKVVIESIVCSCSDPPWEISSIISDIRNLFPYFSVSKFSFCYRSCNEPAHHLARWACISPNWGPRSISSIPPWVFCKKIDGSVAPFLSLPF
ncbi:uncharacterized protein LOC142625056 [Castanea sativa]|uniref:uncharacterized protein LOC142625056 n=1 Tax=Castanea sativa TaxID=21020 RepID=UPI003F654580